MQRVPMARYGVVRAALQKEDGARWVSRNASWSLLFPVAILPPSESGTGFTCRSISYHMLDIF